MILTQRSQEKELLDLGPTYYHQDEYAECLNLLFRMNVLLGFFHGTIKLLKSFSPHSSVLDIGCGGGLFLIRLSQYYPQMKFLGTDISSEAIHLSQLTLTAHQKRNIAKNVTFEIQAEPSLKLPENSVDIILATLVCHHLSDDQLIEFLKDSLKSVNKSVIINDLHRHWLAEWFYYPLCYLFFRNRLIIHDGLISIRRGFLRREWHTLLQKAGIDSYIIKWCFPFRWRIVLWKKS